METISSKPFNHQNNPEQPSQLSLATFEKQKEQISLTKSTTWTQRQLYLIASFFYYHSTKLGSDSSRKKWKVFKIMSNLIQTRNVNQCRSYTKKLFKTFKTVTKINSFFKSSLPRYKYCLQEYKTVNTSIYDNASLLQQESLCFKQKNQKQQAEQLQIKSEMCQKIKQNKVEVIEVDQKQKTNVVLPQLIKRVWLNEYQWLCNYRDFLYWLTNLHYLNFITGCNHNLQ